MDVKEIEARIKGGYQATDAERAFLIAHNPYALGAFMIENNPGSVNFTLRNVLGYDHLGFEPDAKKLARQLELIIQRRDLDSWAAVLKNFRLITDNLTPAFISELNGHINR